MKNEQEIRERLRKLGQDLADAIRNTDPLDKSILTLIAMKTTLEWVLQDEN